MTTKTKAQIDAEIYALVKEGKLTKTAIALKYNTSTRSVGRAVERHEATLLSGKTKAKPAKTLKDIAKSAKKVKATKKVSKQKPVAKAVKEAVKAEPVNALHEAMQNNSQIEYMITGDSVIMTFGAESEIVESTHPNYTDIVMAVVSGEYKKAFELMNIRKSIENFTQGAVTIKGDNLYYGAVQMRSTLVDRILDMMKKGDNGFVRLIAFFEKLMENPSKDSVEQLWGFVSHLDVEIDEEGYIIGWKKVTTRGGKLFDSRTCKVPNDLGNIVEMPRWMVDNNRHVTCSQGLHVGAWDYVTSFSGDTILKVRVHPRDVVSVPTDYNDMKMRASRYEVAAIVNSRREIIKEWDGLEALHVVVGTAGELISQRKREV